MWNQDDKRKEAKEYLRTADNLRDYLDAIHWLIILAENELVTSKHFPKDRLEHIGVALYDIVTARTKLDEVDERFWRELEAIFV